MEASQGQGLGQGRAEGGYGSTGSSGALGVNRSKSRSTDAHAQMITLGTLGGTNPSIEVSAMYFTVLHYLAYPLSFLF